MPDSKYTNLGTATIQEATNRIILPQQVVTDVVPTGWHAFWGYSGMHPGVVLSSEQKAVQTDDQITLIGTTRVQDTRETFVPKALFPDSVTETSYIGEFGYGTELAFVTNPELEAAEMCHVLPVETVSSPFD